MIFQYSGVKMISIELANVQSYSIPFLRNRASIEYGTYTPSYLLEVWLGIMVLVMAVLLIYYMLLTL